MTDQELERLYDAHAGGLFRYLMTFTREEADARDLLQELFIRVARSGPPAEARSEKAWLWRTAHNLAVDWLRRRQARRNAEDQLGGVAADHHPSPNPDEALLASRFAQAMEALPEPQRVVLQLKLWEDMTFEEISEAQGIPLNTAASRYRYALEKLRTVLRPIYEELT